MIGDPILNRRGQACRNVRPMNRLAIRNLFRHRVRSLVTIAAIAFSTIVLIVAAGFIQQIFVDLRSDTIAAGLGHLQVMKPGYLERGAADPYAFLLPESRTDLRAIEALPHVVAVGERLNFNGLISHGEDTLSFVGVGAEPGADAVVIRNLTFVSGSPLAADAADEVIVGQGLANNLGIHSGDRVVLLINTASGSVSAVEANVRGIFSSGFRAFDEVAIRTSLATARKLMKTRGAHSWVVVLDDANAVDATTDLVRHTIDASRYSVVRWIDLADVYTKTVTFLSGQLGVMRALVAIIIVLGVSNMLVMNVLERTGEIGTLMALGVRRRKVVALFILESFYLGLIGSTIGVLLGIGAAKVISAIGVPMPPPPGRTVDYYGAVLVTMPILLSAFSASLGTTLLAGLYPARKASRLVIVDALRFNR
jgi:putative ABC transport system permease protein